MDVIVAYSYGTAGWLTLQATPLILFPKAIITMLSPNVHEASGLEVYLSRSLGFALLALAVLNLLYTGAVPLTSRPIFTEEQPDPYAVPTLTITMLYHFSLAFYCYMSWTEWDMSGFLLGLLGSASMAAMGLWCVMFATEKGHTSKRTGMDKRVSGFPFKNVDADIAKGKKKF